MAALGVMQGNNGKFDPNGTLTREQAAKIITYMVLGKEDADKLTSDVAMYSDVKADRWSAGAIAYCTNERIMVGNGKGKFNPTAKLTGQQFAKTLLVALATIPRSKVWKAMMHGLSTLPRWLPPPVCPTASALCPSP